VTWSKYTKTLKNFSFLKIQLWETEAPIPTKKDDKLLALIGHASKDRLALQAGSRPIQNYDPVVKKGNNHLQNSDSHFREDECGSSLTIHWFGKRSKILRCASPASSSPQEGCTFLLLLYVTVQSELFSSKKKIQQ
jgi:hypothetical protein